MDLFDWHEPADLVICSNVLYHVEDVHGFLRHLKELTKGTLILRTYYNLGDGDNDWTYYGPKRPVHPHPGTAATIFWRPTVRTLEKELHEIGFKNVKVDIQHEIVEMVCS